MKKQVIEIIDVMFNYVTNQGSLSLQWDLGQLSQEQAHIPEVALSHLSLALVVSLMCSRQHAHKSIFTLGGVGTFCVNLNLYLTTALSFFLVWLVYFILHNTLTKILQSSKTKFKSRQEWSYKYDKSIPFKLNFPQDQYPGSDIVGCTTMYEQYGFTEGLFA